MLTTLERDVALVNEFRYRDAKVSVTGSCISTVTASSSLSTLLVWANLMFAVQQWQNL